MPKSAIKRETLQKKRKNCSFDRLALKRIFLCSFRFFSHSRKPVAFRNSRSAPSRTNRVQFHSIVFFRRMAEVFIINKQTNPITTVSVCKMESWIVIVRTEGLKSYWCSATIHEGLTYYTNLGINNFFPSLKVFLGTLMIKCVDNFIMKINCKMTSQTIAENRTPNWIITESQCSLVVLWVTFKSPVNFLCFSFEVQRSIQINLWISKKKINLQSSQRYTWP